MNKLDYFISEQPSGLLVIGVILGMMIATSYMIWDSFSYTLVPSALIIFIVFLALNSRYKVVRKEQK